MALKMVHIMVHRCSGILAIKKTEIMPFAATWMGVEIVILSEVSQTEKEKYHMTFLECGIYTELLQMNLLTKQKETHRLREGAQACWGKRESRSLGWTGTLLYFTWITKKDLLCSTGNSA